MRKSGVFLSGFTLVEVIVALMVLLVTVVSIMASFTSTRRYSYRSRHRIIAGNLARQELEKLFSQVREKTWESTSNWIYAPGFSAQVSTGIVSGDFATNWGGSSSWTTERVGGASSAAVRKVTSQVEWDEPDAQ